MTFPCSSSGERFLPCKPASPSLANNGLRCLFRYCPGAFALKSAVCEAITIHFPSRFAMTKVT